MINSKNFLFFILIGLFSCQQKKASDKTDKSQSFSIAFAGDVLLDRNVKNTIDSLGHKNIIDASYEFYSDFAVVNFENPATKNGVSRQKRFSFNARPEDLKILKAIQATHLNLSNNHSIDCGRNGLIETAKNISSENLSFTGYGETLNKACLPTILEKNGVKVALFSTVGIPIEYYYTLEDKPCICTKKTKELAQYIKAYKKSNVVDHIVVQIHWGTEYELTPSPTQIKQAHQLIDVGADIIIGHHPHVVQSREIYKDKPIFYSIGNFIFDLSNPTTHFGIVPVFTFHKNRFTYKIDSISLESHFPKAI